MCLRHNSCYNQYVEENERLRAILGEWSTRAAKVLLTIAINTNSYQIFKNAFSAETVL